jgi:PmbA protein
VINEDELFRAAESVLDLDEADGVEIAVMGSSTALTRFARSEIIQNTTRHEPRAYVRVVVGENAATATTNQLDTTHCRKAAQNALEAAKVARPDPQWPGLARPEEVGEPEALYRFDEATASASPLDRATKVKEMARASDSKVAGYYQTSSHFYGVRSSTGIRCFDAHTRCVATCLAGAEGSTGWAEESSHSAADVDVAAAARRAANKARRGINAQHAAPGEYQVVLEPAAVAGLIDYLGYAGFGAKQVVEGESFLSARTGEMVAAREVTIADDARHPLSVGIAFDFEGVPRKRVAVIDHGRATQPVTDRRTSRLLGAPLTGHSSGSNEYGPYPANIVLETGRQTEQDLISSVSDGLLITRFHYINVLDRPATLLTGMTRDGTFRITNGEVAEPVRNLRFTQSVLDALQSTTGIGSVAAAFAPEFGTFGSTVAPALRVDGFRFSSTTSH